MPTNALDDLISLTRRLADTPAATPSASGVPGMTANTAALIPRQSGVVDLMGLIRGGRMAQDVAWQDRLRGVQEERFADEMTARGDARLQQEQRQAAATMLRGFNTQRQQAADAGVSPTEFLTGFRSNLLNNPLFQNADPEAQRLAIQALARSATGMAGNLSRLGEPEEANRIVQTFGGFANTSDLQNALLNNQPQQVMGELNRIMGDGSVLDLGDGNVSINGRVVPMEAMMATLTNAGGTPGALNSLLGSLALRDRIQADIRQGASSTSGQGVLGTPSAGNAAVVPSTGDPAIVPSTGDPAIAPSVGDPALLAEQNEQAGDSFAMDVPTLTPVVPPSIPGWLQALQGVDPNLNAEWFSDRGRNQAAAESLFQLVNTLNTPDAVNSFVQSSPDRAQALADLLRQSGREGGIPRGVRTGGGSFDITNLLKRDEPVFVPRADSVRSRSVPRTVFALSQLLTELDRALTAGGGQ